MDLAPQPRWEPDEMIAPVAAVYARTAAWIRKMTRPEATYVGNGVLFVRMKSGLYIFLDGSDVSLTPSILLNGAWEPWVTREFQAALRPGMRVVDIGANCGYYALLAAQGVGPTGKVIAIEANPRLAGLIRRSFAVNGCLNWTDTICAAVMHEVGEVELGTPDGFLGSTSVLLRQDDRSGPINTIRAPGAPLGDLLGDDIRVDLLKIDAEGAEPMIWRGADAVLAANPRMKIFMEFSPPMISSTVAPAEFLTTIRAAGFVMDELTPNGVVTLVSDTDLLAKDWAELRLYRPNA